MKKKINFEKLTDLALVQAELNAIEGGTQRTMSVCISATNYPEYECGDQQTRVDYDGSANNRAMELELVGNPCLVL